jgi:hypothetical protein
MIPGPQPQSTAPHRRHDALCTALSHRPADTHRARCTMHNARCTVHRQPPQPPIVARRPGCSPHPPATRLPPPSAHHPPPPTHSPPTRCHHPPAAATHQLPLPPPPLQGDWTAPFVEDFKLRFMNLLPGAFRAMAPVMALSILDPKLAYSEAEAAAGTQVGRACQRARGGAAAARSKGRRPVVPACRGPGSLVAPLPSPASPQRPPRPRPPRRRARWWCAPTARRCPATT